MIGFAFFGWAWPVFVLAGRILAWIVTVLIFAAVVIYSAIEWVADRVWLR